MEVSKDTILVGLREVLSWSTEIGVWKKSTGNSVKSSKESKKRSFKYLGSVTIYSHSQESGIINNHGADCMLAYIIAAIVIPDAPGY